jgi:hypothetical protein
MSLRARAMEWVIEIMSQRADLLPKLDGLYDDAILLKNALNQMSQEDFKISDREKMDIVDLLSRNLDGLTLLIDEILSDKWEQTLLFPLL